MTESGVLRLWEVARFNKLARCSVSLPCNLIKTCMCVSYNSAARLRCLWLSVLYCLLYMLCVSGLWWWRDGCWCWWWGLLSVAWQQQLVPTDTSVLHPLWAIVLLSHSRWERHDGGVGWTAAASRHHWDSLRTLPQNTTSVFASSSCNVSCDVMFVLICNMTAALTGAASATGRTPRELVQSHVDGEVERRNRSPRLVSVLGTLAMLDDQSLR